jgi:C1A family cysteine protease
LQGRGIKRSVRSTRYYYTGWLPEQQPNAKDIKENDARVRGILKPLFTKTGLEGQKPTLPEMIKNLVDYFPPAFNQENMFSCTANAATAVTEYYSLRQSKATYAQASSDGRHTPLSRLFVYFNARKLREQEIWDDGASIRATLGALKLFGTPAESFWPYEREKRFREPSAFLYSLASANKIDKYIIHDSDNTEDTLYSVKKYLTAGVPSVFGFKAFESFRDEDKISNGEFPFPSKEENVELKHSMVVVGFDDNKRIRNPISEQEEKGALQIRNCWGEDWGVKGYGWLPYRYVLEKLAYEFWSILKMDFVDLADFDTVRQ